MRKSYYEESESYEANIDSEEEDSKIKLFEPYLEEKERDSNTEDWSEIADDLDAGDWEKIMGGPDDDNIERYYENLANNYEEDND